MGYLFGSSSAPLGPLSMDVPLTLSMYGRQEGGLTHDLFLEMRSPGDSSSEGELPWDRVCVLPVGKAEAFVRRCHTQNLVSEARL